MNITVLDCEGDGLLDTITKLHVISWTTDGKTYNSVGTYEEMRQVLLKAIEGPDDMIACHNAVQFDAKAFELILGVTIPSNKIVDTLMLSQFLYPDRPQHGLASWGEDLGVKKPDVEDWEGLTYEEYRHRCVEDVKINWRVWQRFYRRLGKIWKGDPAGMWRFVRYLSFKADCLAEQEDNPVYFDMDKLREDIEELTAGVGAKVQELQSVMPDVPEMKKKKKPKGMQKKDGTLSKKAEAWYAFLKEQGLPSDTEGEVAYVAGWKEPNPNSHQQVKAWLNELGWDPCTWDFKKDDKGERMIPQVRKDGELTPSVKLLIEREAGVAVLDGLTVMNHRLSILTGFVEAVGENIRTEGNRKIGWASTGAQGLTNTLRLKHRKPVVNLPSVEAEFGEMIRGAIVAPEGYVVCGADVSSLESCTKRHYMFPWDPEYVEEMSVEGFDEHLDLAVKAGEITSEEYFEFQRLKVKDKAGEMTQADHDTLHRLTGVRKMYKPVNYAGVYGVGKTTLARQTGYTEKRCQQLIDSYWERNWAVKKVAETTKTKSLGDKSMWLWNPVARMWYSLRTQKDIFSTLNQGTGVFVFDNWVREMRKRGIKVVFQYHDEVFFYVRKGEEEKTLKLLEEAMQAVNDMLKLNVPISMEAKFGGSYAEVH